jgi:hypothetical protein
MSISPLHGGLVFNDEPAKTTNNSQKEEEKTQIGGIKSDLNSRDINEFFNPRVSELSLDERVQLCVSVGEEII